MTLSADKYQATGSGAANRSVVSKLADTVSVFDYMTTAEIADVQAGTALVAVDAAIQDAIDSLTTGGMVFFPKGTYEITSAIAATAYNGIVLKGEGYSSVIQNSTSGNTIEVGDGVTPRADMAVTDLRVVNSVAAGACIYIRDCPNSLVEDNVITSSGVGGYGVRVEGSWDTKIFKNNFGGIKGYGIHSSLLTRALSIVGNRMDGDGTTVASIGIYLGGGDSVSVSGANAIESFAGCGILADGTRGLNITGNYFETNAETGVTFTSGDARTIKSDVIINGSVFPVLGNAFPSYGTVVTGNAFLPHGTAAIDSSIYLIGCKGFTEDGNSVASAYFSAASFIKTKANAALYSTEHVSLGSSYVHDLAQDKYLDVENTNNAAMTSYDYVGIRSMEMDANFAPIFNAQEITGTAPTAYTEIFSGTPKLVTTLATGRYKGQLTYDVTNSVATGTSGGWGVAIAETDFDGFYDGELWVAYFSVKAKTNTPGFEILINADGTYRAAGGGSATTSSWVDRAIVFKPVTGTDFVFVYRMYSAASTSDAVTITKPVICPLGQVQNAIPLGM